MKNLKYYKQKLMEEKEELIDEVDGFDNRGYEGLDHSMRESTGELSNYDNHPADGGTDTFDRSKDLGLKDNDRIIIKMIDDALKKIESGNYGLCDACQKEIDSERLEVIPYSTFCYECKEKVEMIPDNVDRPMEEDLLGELHGRMQMNLDYEDSVIHDGEDTWQKLAQYGTSNTPSDMLGAHNDDDSYLNADEEVGLVGWGEGIIDQEASNFTEQFEDEESHLTGQRRKDDRE
ncbi:TraR/DksA C4-type zinc finger protein [Natroniella sp. ANB-PHB2]|uniref:TraR/DksA C4-type zinc finger protein n=1 Tax=Natroniella sp. ANB-PHB2 TaxID=3384444 RepID=UPI0038D3D9B5